MTIHGGSSDWLVVFGDSWMAQSAIDRFRNNAYDVVIEGESYRPRLKPKIEKDIPPPAAPVVKRPGSPRRSRRT